MGIGARLVFEADSMIEAGVRAMASCGDGDDRGAVFLTEALLIHARNLVSFLLTPQESRFDDDMRPGDLVDGWDPGDMEPLLREVATEVNKIVFHLSWLASRGEVEWDHPDLVYVVFEALERFFAHCAANQVMLMQGNMAELREKLHGLAEPIRVPCWD